MDFGSQTQSREPIADSYSLELKEIKMKKVSSFVFIVIIVAIMLVSVSCETKKTIADAASLPEKANNKPSVQAAKVELRSYQEKIEASGNLMPVRRAKISALTDGALEKINLDMGSRVKKGQALFQVSYENYKLSHEQAAANLDRVKADLALAEKEKSRVMELFEKDSISGQERDRAVSACEQLSAVIRQAEAAEKMAYKNLRDCTITAPFSGVVTQKFSQKGEFVKRGDPVVEIVDIKTLEAELKLPEIYAGMVKTGFNVNLNCREISGAAAGSVIGVNPEVDTGNRTFIAKVGIDNGDEKLQAGLYCTARFIMPAIDNQMAIHPKSIIRDNGKTSVWVVSDGKAYLKYVVEDGLFEDGWVRIIEGLTSADSVIIEGKSGLSEGQEVAITE